MEMIFKGQTTQLFRYFSKPVAVTSYDVCTDQTNGWNVVRKRISRPVFA